MKTTCENKPPNLAKKNKLIHLLHNNMFWKYTNPSLSEIESLLQRPDVTLQEVLDSNDIINECRLQRKALIDFLLKPETISELVEYTIQEPSPDLDINIRFKNATMSCELLTADVPAISERLACDEHLLDKLYSFLERAAPLNPLLASYFSKIMGALIAKKTEQNWLSYQFTCLQVLDFLKAKDTFLPLLFKHLGTSAIMDLTLKLMTQVENSETRQSMLNWLNENKLIESLIYLLNVNVDQQRHENVAQLLCDFIEISRDTFRNSTERIETDPLLETLESSDTVSALLCLMFEKEQSHSVIIAGIKILNALLTFDHSAFTDSLPRYMGNDCEAYYNGRFLQQALHIIKAHLKYFRSILLDPPKQLPVMVNVGVLDPPFGNTRLQVLKLLTVVLSKDNVELVEGFVDIDLFTVLLDLFFQYRWNNFLHTQIENCLMFALKTVTSLADAAKSNALCSHLLVNCSLIERMLNAWKENDKNQNEKNAIRQPYMGHVIAICSHLSELSSNTCLGRILKETAPEVATEFEEFGNSTLKDAIDVQNTLLGGIYPGNLSKVEFNDGQGCQGEVLLPNAPFMLDNISNGTRIRSNNDDDDVDDDDDDDDNNFNLSNDKGDSAVEPLPDDVPSTHWEDYYYDKLCSEMANVIDTSDDERHDDIFEEEELEASNGDEVFSNSEVNTTSQRMAESGESIDVNTRLEVLIDNDPWSVCGVNNNDCNDSKALLEAWADFDNNFQNMCRIEGDFIPNTDDDDVQVCNPGDPVENEIANNNSYENDESHNETSTKLECTHELLQHHHHHHHHQIDNDETLCNHGIENSRSNPVLKTVNCVDANPSK